MENIKNCGLVALENMTDINDVSMFSLIHLAKDNGLKLYFCKVEPDELVNVARPAIFHQKDHFVFVENGEAMPKGEYDGYVLTPRPLHEPLPYSLAKKVRGRKKGGGIISTIVTAVAFVVNPLLGAAVGAGVGAHRASGGAGFDYDAQGEWWRIPTGAVKGYTAVSSPGTAALFAAGEEIPRAVKTGDWMAPISAGIGQYGVSTGIGGVAKGIAGAGAGTGFLETTKAGLKGGFNALTGKPIEGASVGIEGPAMSLASGGVGDVSGRLIPGVGGPSMSLAGGGDVAGQMTPGVSRLASGASVPGTSKGFNLFEKVGKKFGEALPGVVASMAISPPKLDYTPKEDFSKAAQFLGDENFKALPTSTRKQLEKHVNTPLDQLAQEFYTPDDKGIRMLEEKKQKAVDSIMVQYANYGQDPYDSTEAQSRLTEINCQYDQAISEYQQQIQDEAMNQAIEFKQNILAKAMEQGQFDYEAAMELATHMGLGDQYRYSLESKDYDALQKVLAKLFSFNKEEA